MSLPRMLCGLPRPPLPQPRHRCVRGAAAAGLLETTVCCHRSVHMLAPFPLRAIVPLLGCRPPLGGRRASPTTTRALDPRAPNYASVTTLELLEFPAVMEQVRPMPTAMVKAGRARGMRILPTAPRVCVTVSPPPPFPPPGRLLCLHSRRPRGCDAGSARRTALIPRGSGGGWDGRVHRVRHCPPCFQIKLP